MDARCRIPGWLDAVLEEQDLNDEVWSEPFDKIASIRVRHMTLIDALRLQREGNPFVSMTPPDELTEDNVAFAMQMVCYLADGFLDGSLLQRAFIKSKVKRANRYQLIKDCASYTKKTILTVSAKRIRGKIEPSPWSYIAEYYHVMGSEYGITLQDFEEMPLRKILQMIRVRTKSNNPKAQFPSRADDILGEYLERKNSPSNV